MTESRSRSAARAGLLDVIGYVRRRWRLKILLRGLFITAASGLAFFLIAAYGLERLNFAPGAVLTFRIAALLTVVALLGRFVLWPMRRRVTDEQVALYLEEHEPSLQNTLISALESDGATVSPAFARRTIEQAVERCRAIEDGRRIDRRELNRFATAFAIVAVLGLALTGFGPPILRHGAGALLNPFGSAEEANPYRIDVLPGNATIARGSDQVVTAVLHGWNERPGANGVAQQIEIALRPVGDSVFQRLPLTATDSSFTYEVLLFDVASATEYYIDADGIRSPMYRIDVADLPYVESIQLEYDYPDYTGLPNEVIDDGGDIVALRGTTVIVRATTTMPVASARILLDDGRAIRMQPDATGVMSGGIVVSAEGFYMIELMTADSTTVTGSPQYLIDVIDDRGPNVRIAKPGHDTRPTNVEEVFVEVSAEDDFGIAELELVYNVNGGEERVVKLLNAAQPLPEASAGHTFYLEELDLKPGDLISYYARAKDNGGANAKEATSDIFFMNVRPFGRDYRQAEQAGGGGGGGQQGENPGELSQRQREIITATFNLIRDSAQFGARDYEEALNTIALMQDRLREQVNTLHGRMNNRQVTQDSMFAKIARILPVAVQEMERALERLREPQTREALGFEQRALLQLQHAEALFREVQIMFQQQGGGGGGGGGAPNAEDLADLFELERDQLRNQYETVQRGEQQQQMQNQAEIDAALERLRQLARRQEQENERLRQQAAMRQNQQGGGGGAQSQRQLADETEEAARQLERLSREMNRPELEQVARELQQAANEMRRSAANARSGNTANANSALNRLEEARRRLERNMSQSLEQQAQDAVQRAERLAQEQREIARDMQRLEGMSGQERAHAGRELVERKTELANEVGQLNRDLNGLVASSRTQQRDAARRLQDAANSLRDNRVEERILFSRQFAVASGSEEYARAFEEEITRGIEQVREHLEQARQAIAENPEQRTGEALDRLRRLARGMESMQERTREASEQGQQGQGQQGEQGQQQGQQGQQQGQQGQGQQGQQGGQQGQQGGQQGQQQGQGGQQGGQANPQGGGDRNGPGGAVNPGSAGGAIGAIGWRGGVISEEEARQFRAELRQRLAEAQELRQELSRQGRDVSDLDGVIRDLRALQSTGIWADPAALARLQSQVVDGLKQYEYGLRRDILGAERDRLFLSGSDEVPEAYRRLVEEYYRSLARDRQ